MKVPLVIYGFPSFICMVLGITSRVSYALGNCSATAFKLHPYFIFDTKDYSLVPAMSLNSREKWELLCSFAARIMGGQVPRIFYLEKT